MQTSANVDKFSELLLQLTWLLEEFPTAPILLTSPSPHLTPLPPLILCHQFTIKNKLTPTSTQLVFGGKVEFHFHRHVSKQANATSLQLFPSASCFYFHRSEEKAFEGTACAPITWAGGEAAACTTLDWLSFYFRWTMDAITHAT